MRKSVRILGLTIGVLAMSTTFAGPAHAGVEEATYLMVSCAVKAKGFDYPLCVLNNLETAGLK
ncbi:hypothetical protein [Nocardia sp. XZ_19_385]|uniref:hypothetical protein n=1 Tax=Nocardia sp. XZ_19_385 TaxID=2769488 RepID=UPI001890688F|nr:hypothetical protein [Nocardia sp. XZ_19_385]